MTMKRHVCYPVLGVLLALVGASCEQPDTVSSTTDWKIGVLLYGDSRIPQTDGFLDGLKELGFEPGRNVAVTVLNAKNDKAKLAGYARTLIEDGANLLVASGGLEAEALRKQIGDRDIPLIVLYINAIVERGFVRERRNPGWNVTGVDNLNAELSGKRVELLHALVPEARRILVLYHPKIKPSVIGVEHARTLGRKLGLTIVDREVRSREDIERTMASLERGQVDAMLTVPTAPIDNALKEFILPHVERLGIALMTHSRPMAEAGALASYGAPFYDLGKQASRLAGKILNGTRADRIPFEVPMNYVYTVNRSTMNRLNIELSDLARSQINEFVD